MNSCHRFHYWVLSSLPFPPLLIPGEGTPFLADGSSAALLQSEVAALRMQVSHLEGADADVDTLLAENERMSQLIVSINDGEDGERGRERCFRAFI